MDQVVIRPPQHERIVAAGLLAQRELSLLTPSFDRIWPVEDAPNFNELLRAIDNADERFQRAGSRLRKIQDS